MRDRLIELLEQKSCVYVPCDNECGGCKNVEMYDDSIESIADHLLAEGVIVPPCKVGQTVYYLTSVDTKNDLDVTEIFEGTVQGIGIDEKAHWISVKYTNGLFYYHPSKDFGKTVFLTPEEANKKLKELGE